MLVTPIYIPVNTQMSGGGVSILDVLVVLLCCSYITQLLFVMVGLLVDEFTSKKEFLFWCIPFAWLYIIYKKFTDL